MVLQWIAQETTGEKSTGILTLDSESWQLGPPTSHTDVDLDFRPRKTQNIKILNFSIQTFKTENSSQVLSWSGLLADAPKSRFTLL